MAADEKGQLTIAYVAGRRDSAGSYPSTVFVVRSTDRGETWGPHHVVTNVSQSPAYEPKVIIDASGTLHLVWMRHRPNDITPEAVWHAESVDGGATWSNFSSLPVSGLVARSHAVMDRCGVIHYVVESHRDGSVELAYARLLDGRWSGWQWPFEGTIGAMASMKYDGRDRVLLAWETAQRSAIAAWESAQRRGIKTQLQVQVMRSELRLR
jgi:hypothetical protein